MNKVKWPGHLSSQLPWRGLMTFAMLLISGAVFSARKKTGTFYISWQREAVCLR